jgi:F0F1-type ATP synthase membrane subunit c/vacuolar-type H+-ATPase subunit K
MTLALRKQFQPRSLPQVSFGPFRFLEALPWLIMAAAMRVVAFGGGAVAFPALVVASIAVLHAFLVVAQRSIELNHGQTNLGELDFAEQFRLSKAVLWRIALLMFAAGCALLAAGFTSFAPNMLDGLDGIAFDQSSDIGKFWSAAIAALVLLMIVDAERNHGRVSFMRALGELARRGLWIGTAVLVLGVAYLGLGLGQGWVRSAIWNFWQVSASSQFIKNLIYFVFIFSFAMLRLWISLLILTYGLKQSYTRGS